MFQSYLKMAWRSLIKNKIASVINIAGLAVGLATTIIIMLLVTDEFSYDNFHANLPHIYLLMKNQKHADGISTGDASAGPFAAALRTEIPETKWAARVAYFGNQLTSANDKSVFEDGIYADPDLFKMMTFPAIAGDPVSALENPNSVVITETTAKKFFGNKNPVGKILLFKNSNSFKVAAVIKDIPSNSSIRFDMVLPFRFFESGNNWLNKWDDNRINTWVQLKPAANIRALDAKLTKLLQTRSNDSSVETFVYPMAAKRLYGNFSNGKPNGGRIYMVAMLAVLGIFILLIACINFMNLATARSEHRAREVGVRKVMGASRKLIIIQFLSEAMLLSLLALFLAIALARLFLPSFNLQIEKNLNLDTLTMPRWLLILGIGLFTGLIAGSYPALFLSRFKTVNVLKGFIINGRRGGGLRSILVTFQFFVSIFLIIATIVIFTQINYVRNRPIGYDQENLININATGELASNFYIFRNELAAVRGVQSVSAGSDNILQYGGAVTGMDWPGKVPGQELGIIVTDVQYGWTKTTGLKMIKGRDFDPAFGTDTTACLVNQALIDKTGIKEPVIGAMLGGKRIIGVFQDFVYNNPSGVIAPMSVSLNTGSLGHFFVRIRNNNQWRQTVAAIEKIAKKINPGYPFEYSFTKEDYQKRFEEFSSFGWLAALFGALAIFISCLGLYGLSAFLAERRSKEMSIRKVLGASLQNVWLSLSRDFLKPVVIAFLLVVPLAVWAMHALLSNMVYHISLDWWIFATAGGMAIMIALLIVSYQGIKTALENPVTSLRNE